MKLTFRYDVDMDVQNYIRTSKSINNKRPTPMQERYVAIYGDVFDDENLKKFINGHIRDNDLDMERIVQTIREGWQPIEVLSLDRIRNIFDHEGPSEPITVYLTTDSRCSLNPEKGYFFVSIPSPEKPSPNKTILHELLHFWTWYAFGPQVESGEMSKEFFNDMKESLTELLNIEFADLLNGVRDEGYPQHQELRKIVRSVWMETRDVRTVVEKLKAACTEHEHTGESV